MNTKNTVYSLFIWIIILSTLVVMCYKLMKRLFPNLLIFEEVNDVVVREEEVRMEHIAGEEVFIR